METDSPTAPEPIGKTWILDELLICCPDTSSPDVRKHRMRAQKYQNVRMIWSQNELGFFENSEPYGQIFQLQLDDVDKTLVFIGPVCQVRWGPPPGNCYIKLSLSIHSPYPLQTIYCTEIEYHGPLDPVSIRYPSILGTRIRWYPLQKNRLLKSHTKTDNETVSACYLSPRVAIISEAIWKQCTCND